MLTGKNVQKLASLTGAATGAQAAVNFQLGPDVAGTAVVLFSGTGSVMIQGRISPEAPWVDLIAAAITEATDSAVATLARVLPEMRANVTANSANCDVWVMA